MIVECTNESKISTERNLALGTTIGLGATAIVTGVLAAISGPPSRARAGHEHACLFRREGFGGLCLQVLSGCRTGACLLSSCAAALFAAVGCTRGDVQGSSMAGRRAAAARAVAAPPEVARAAAVSLALVVVAAVAAVAAVD